MDLVHEAWVAVLRRHPKTRHLPSVDALAAELARVARWKTVDVVRQRLAGQKRAVSREQAGGGSQEALPSSTTDTPSMQAIANETWARMLADLSPLHRQVAELLREGHNRAVVARFTGLSVSTVDRVVRHLKDTCGW